MSRKLFFMLLFFLFQISYAEPFLIAYYPDWLMNTTTVQEIRFDGITHIIQSFAWPNSAGELVYNNSILSPELIEEAHENDVYVMIALGGWGQSESFSSVCADSGKRADFIDNIMDFCSQNGFDGVDIDWEHPATPEDKNNLTLFVQELREKMDETDKKYFLSIAIISGSWGASKYDYTKLKDNLDWFGAMSYDFHGNWVSHIGHCSPLYPSPANDPEGSVSTSMNYLKSKGIPPEKIVMGVPFYGIQFQGKKIGGAHSGAAQIVYSNIFPLISSADYTKNWDDLAQAPYLVKNDSSRLITYDDSLSIALKAHYALEEELGGVMVWAMGQDDLGTEQPLMNSLILAMKNHVSINEITGYENITEKSLITVFPNPSADCPYFCFFSKSSLSPMSYEIFNILGQKVYSGNTSFFPSGWNRFSCNNLNLSSGSYYILLQNRHQTWKGKFIIIR